MPSGPFCIGEYGNMEWYLTLSRVAPSAVSKGWGGLIGPPHVSKGVGVVLFSNFSCNLRSDHDWHQAKGFTTFRCLEPLQLIVWKKRLFLGFLRFVRVPPYESWANWTNFYFSCENGDILLSRKSCNLFHTKNEEKSQKISTRIRIPTCVYANTWQGGLIRPPPTLNRVKFIYWANFSQYIGFLRHFNEHMGGD